MKYTTIFTFLSEKVNYLQHVIYRMIQKSDLHMLLMCSVLLFMLRGEVIVVSPESSRII